MRTLFLVAVILSAVLAAPAANAQTDPRRVETSLHSSRATVAPGETFTVVLRQRIAEHWHTYWRNPGAAGEPADISWSLPPGFEASQIQWPAPFPTLAANLVNYGYTDEVLLPVEMRAGESLRPGQRAQFSANVYLVVCSEDTCVPEESTIALSIPVAAEGRDDPVWGPRIAATLASLPRRDDSFTAHITPGPTPVLSVALANVRTPYFFAFDRDAVDYAQDQTATNGVEGFSISLPAGAVPPGRTPLEGVLTFTDANGARRAVEISAAPGPVLPGVSAAGQGAGAASLDAAALITAIVLAFAGGLILNIMPCVLPVLSVKAIAFAGSVQGGEARRHGALYFAGVMATFLALGAVLIALREAGEAVGWGFQLQAPWMTAGLALLFYAIGLNLLGVFNIGGGENVGAGLIGRGGDAGAFFTGALAVIAATPCTAPFMASAVGVAVTQSAATTLLIFAALAVGFALPLTALHFAPGLQRLLPKPGAWMERAKNLLAFPMFAAAVWLTCVMAEQTGSAGVLALLSLAAALGLVVFVARWGRIWLIAGAAVFALTAGLMWHPLLGMEQEVHLVSEPWSPARVTQLRGEARGVFVNFTAAWCVTCKVNEAAAFTPRVAEAFASKNVAYLEADWTNRDDTISAALAEHGRAGVPLYLYYPPNGEPRVLAQLLSEALILETIEGEVE